MSDPLPGPQVFRRRLRTLQAMVLGFGTIPVAAGLGGVILGPSMVGGDVGSVGLDSHFRYLSGLLLAIGLAYWSLVPGLERHGAGFRLLTALVFVGGLGRLVGVVVHGWPPAPMLGALIMELVVTPALCLLQASLAQHRIAR